MVALDAYRIVNPDHMIGLVMDDGLDALDLNGTRRGGVTPKQPDWPSVSQLAEARIRVGRVKSDAENVFVGVCSAESTIGGKTVKRHRVSFFRIVCRL